MSVVVTSTMPGSWGLLNRVASRFGRRPGQHVLGLGLSCRWKTVASCTKQMKISAFNALCFTLPFVLLSTICDIYLSESPLPPISSK